MHSTWQGKSSRRELTSKKPRPLEMTLFVPVFHENPSLPTNERKLRSRIIHTNTLLARESSFSSDNLWIVHSVCAFVEIDILRADTSNNSEAGVKGKKEDAKKERVKERKRGRGKDVRFAEGIITSGAIRLLIRHWNYTRSNEDRT